MIAMLNGKKIYLAIEILGVGDIQKYSVTYNLTNVTSSSSATTVVAGASYATRLTPAEGYEMSAITVTMGGVEVAYDTDSNNVSIDVVTGDIVITATAKVIESEVTYAVTNNLTYATSTNTTSEIIEGSRYVATITPVAGYELDSLSVTVGGVEQEIALVGAGTTIELDGVTGDIVVTAVAVKLYNVIYQLKNVASAYGAMPTTVKQGGSIGWSAQATEGYKITTAYAAMSSTTYSGSYFDTDKWLFTISKVTGDITVVVIAESIHATVTHNLTNVTSSNTTTSVEKGTSYVTALAPVDGYEIDTVTITMGGVDKSGLYQAGSGIISIGSVTGDLVITATAKFKIYTVTYKYTNTTGDNSQPRTPAGSSYETTLTPCDGYVIDTVTVTMDGVEQEVTVRDFTADISIAEVTGDIVITAVSVKKYTVNTTSIRNATMSNTATYAKEGSEYYNTITPNTGHIIAGAQATMGDEILTFSPLTGGCYIYIPSVTGDIVITATIS